MFRTPLSLRTMLTAGLAVLTLAATAAVPLAQAPAEVTAESLFGQLRWRNIGPANMAGRVTDATGGGRLSARVDRRRLRG